MSRKNISRNNHSCHLNNFLGGLKVAQKKKSAEYTYWPASNAIINTVNALRHEGFIFSYTISELQSCKKIRVYLKYLNDGRPLISNIRFLSTTGFPRYTNKKYLNRFLKFHPGWVYFVSTSFGVKTLSECCLRRFGGYMLFGIS